MIGEEAPGGERHPVLRGHALVHITEELLQCCQEYVRLLTQRDELAQKLTKGEKELAAKSAHLEALHARVGEMLAKDKARSAEGAPPAQPKRATKQQ
jgi:hypothetical protein